MLYMKEMRAKVIAECTLKESAAINQILGRRVRGFNTHTHTHTHSHTHTQRIKSVEILQILYGLHQGLHSNVISSVK